MTSSQPRNPLHGVTLEAMVTELVAEYAWEGMAERIRIRCFAENPSVGSSLKFLRKTPWARAKVEGLYLFLQRERARQARRAGPRGASGASGAGGAGGAGGASGDSGADGASGDGGAG